LRARASRSRGTPPSAFASWQALTPTVGASSSTCVALRAACTRNGRDETERALLGDKSAVRADGRRVGIPLRWLWALLPAQARGRGYRRGALHRHRVTPARTPPFPLPQLLGANRG